MTGHVLVVDDSLTVRGDLEDSFREAGFDVSTAPDLATARRALGLASGGGLAVSRVDLVVLDLHLPDGDGLDLLRELRAEPATADLPVVLLTSRDEVADRIRGLEAGAHDFAGKPYDRRYLLTRVAELLAERAGNEGKAGAPCIQVVDDSLTFRHELRASLEAAGYRVVEAGSVRQGLRVAALERPDALVVDGALGDDNGADLVQRVRMDPALSTTPCLLLTASLDRDQEIQALGSGADAFLRKDQGMDVVIARVNALLQEDRRTAVHEATRGPWGGGARSPVRSLYGATRVLAVDDSETFLQVLAGNLRNDGYDVVLARSGEDALALLAAQTVHCVLLDLLMPGLDGRETCRRIKASPAWRDIPVIMLTAREDRETMLDGIQAGADDYIAKSGDFEVVRARLRAQIRRKQIEAEARRTREDLYRAEMDAARERAGRELAESKTALLDELEGKNRELEHKNRQLEEFAYVASHDLQAPLRAVSRFSQLLVQRYGDRLDGDAQEFVGFIVDGVARMQALIRDLLAYSRATGADQPLVPLDCAEAYRQAMVNLEAVLDEAGATVECGDLPRVRGNLMQLTQVFQNLIGNAVKYRGDAPPRVRVDAERCDGMWLLRVQDNGIGIDPRHADRVFGIFKRLNRDPRYSGTGIGLAICKRVVEIHGGEIRVESQLGEGSTFLFSLQDAAAGDEVPAANATPPEEAP